MICPKCIATITSHSHLAFITKNKKKSLIDRREVGRNEELTEK